MKNKVVTILEDIGLISPPEPEKEMVVNEEVYSNEDILDLFQPIKRGFTRYKDRRRFFRNYSNMLREQS
tara:strand:+ start:136 stop:342 length:207 start_codon:yes stop_codon:yes gene_type:complete